MVYFAQALAAYAQPALDATDGSPEQVQRAMCLAQLCWTLALMPDAEQDEMLAGMPSAFNMDDATYAEFRQSAIAPMIERHHAMFPHMPRMDDHETGPPPRPKK